MLALIRTQMFMILANSIFATPLQLERPNSILQLVPLNSTNLPTIDSSSLKEDPCFIPRSDRLPTTYADCVAALDEMKDGRSGRTSFLFGRGDLVSYKLPRTFIRGTCALNLDMVYDDQTARLTIRQVGYAALNLIQRCTPGAVFNRGGSIAVGPSNVLYVTIIGVAVSSTP